MITIEYKAPTGEQWKHLVSFTTWQQHSSKTFELAARNSLFFVTAYDENNIVGMAQVTGDGILSCSLQYLVVGVDYRNMGIGKKIVKKALEKIEETCNPDAVISLFSSLHNQPFYEKLGFHARDYESKGPAMLYYIE